MLPVNHLSFIALSLTLVFFHALLINELTIDKVPPSYSSPSLDEKNMKNFPGFLVIVGTVVGTLLILMNVLLIGCCLHRRSKKRVSGN